MITDPKKTMLVVGGCRSGKSRFAERWAVEHFSRRVFVATSIVTGDEEMQRRVDLHRQRRDENWQTVEEPYNISEVLRRASSEAGVFVVDCLTLWLTNLLMQDLTDAEIEERVQELAEAVVSCPVSVVLVANEVGLGIVPEAALARRFRDIAGWCNQKIGERCETVVFVAAGLPLYLKGTPAISA